MLAGLADLPVPRRRGNQAVADPVSFCVSVLDVGMRPHLLSLNQHAVLGKP